jgi:hypothetical protein
MAAPEGLEPPTLGSEDQCSIQLSYGAAINLANSTRAPASAAPVHSSSKKHCCSEAISRDTS